MDQQLNVFVKVAELKNFSRAAEKLHMTQPAVSQYIRSLEQTIGNKLLERSNKHVKLTKAGEVVYHHAIEILGLYARMQNVVDDLAKTVSGEISIGASYTYGEYVLPHIIASMRRQYPLIKPTISIDNTSEIAQLVAKRQLDVGIVEGNFLQPRLYAETFAEDHMYVFVSDKHPFASKDIVELSQLQEETWIVREPGSGSREATDRFFSLLPARPANLLEFGSTQVIKESVEAGLGITLLSQWAAQKELTLKSLKIAKVTGTPVVRQFSIITQTASFQTNAMKAFWELVRKA